MRAMTPTLLGGQEVLLPKWFLEERGHDWYQRLVSTLPCLRGVGRDEAGVMLKIVQMVIADEPQLLVADAAETLRLLLRVEYCRYSGGRCRPT